MAFWRRVQSFFSRFTYYDELPAVNPRPWNFLTVALCCLSLAACATTSPDMPTVPITPGPVTMGMIAYVNNENGFVLIRTAEMPAEGTALQARTTDGDETATLRVSAEQKRPFIIADIVEGQPQVGETVTR